MKYKVQHLGRNNLQDETIMGAAGSQIHFERSLGDTGQKQGKNFMLIFVCCMRVKICTSRRDYSGKQREWLLVKKNYPREEIEWTGLFI